MTRWADELEVGAELVSAARTIGEREVAAFADLTGDRHPVHVDADWAASSIFGERIAHGLLVVACAVGAFELDPERVVALRRIRGLTFKRPAPLGTVIRAHGRIDRVAPALAGIAIVTLDWRIVDGAGATLARATVDLLWRSAAAPPPARLAP